MQQLLHISFNGNLPETLYPRQPDGSDDPTKSGGKEENLPPRVSFAPSIQECFSAIYPNVSHFFEEENLPYMIFFVYSYVEGSGKRISQSLVRKKVWDASVTKEVCFYTPVKIRKISKIKIYNPGGNAEEIYCHPYGDTSLKKEFVSPKIRYETLEQYFY